MQGDDERKVRGDAPPFEGFDRPDLGSVDPYQPTYSPGFPPEPVPPIHPSAPPLAYSPAEHAPSEVRIVHVHHYADGTVRSEDGSPFPDAASLAVSPQVASPHFETTGDGRGGGYGARGAEEEAERRAKIEMERRMQKHELEQVRREKEALGSGTWKYAHKGKPTNFCCEEPCCFVSRDYDGKGYFLNSDHKAYKYVTIVAVVLIFVFPPLGFFLLGVTCFVQNLTRADEKTEYMCAVQLCPLVFVFGILLFVGMIVGLAVGIPLSSS